MLVRCPCCSGCQSPESQRHLWTEMKEVGDEEVKEVEDTQPLQFWVPKKHSTVSSNSSLYSNDNASCQEGLFYERKASNSSIVSDISVASTLPGVHSYLSDMASILETLQENETSQESLHDDNAPTGADADSPEPPCGQAVFSVSYDQNRGRLLVHLDRVLDLPSKGTEKPYDSFVKVCLLPSKTSRLSRTIKSAQNPCFHEDFVFPVDRSKSLKKRVLRLSVYDYERQGRHDAVGHVLHSLKGIEQENLKDKKRCQSPLLPQSMPVHNLGKLLMSLCFIPEQDRLTVAVYRGSGLRLDTSSLHLLRRASKLDSFQTYLKITLMCSGEKVKTERTLPVSAGEVFNQSYHFVVPQAYLRDTSIVVTAMARGLLKQDAVIGRIVSGPYLSTAGDQLTHWGQMVKDRRPVARWRQLYL